MKKLQSIKLVYAVVLLSIALLATLAIIWLPSLNDLLSNGDGYKPY